MSQDIRTGEVTELPYPRNDQVSSERLLDEDDSFFAGSSLEYCDADHTSPILAIGDSMFHKLRFGERAERGEGSKVSLGGGRVSEISQYLQEL